MRAKKLLADTSWAEGRASIPWLVGWTTFGILAIELALIRWTSAQVRTFAYINNIVLMNAQEFGPGEVRTGQNLTTFGYCSVAA